MRSEEELRTAIHRYADMIRKICFIHMKQESDVDDVFSICLFEICETIKLS